MNVKRGLFRLWVAASLLWVCAVSAFSYSFVAKEFHDANVSADWGKYKLLLPVKCSEARGEANKDYTTIQYKEPGPWEKYATCWYKEEPFRKLWPEYEDLDIITLSDRLYDNAEIPHHTADPWGVLAQAVAWAVIPIMALFALGYLLVWVGAGFAAPPHTRT